VPISWNTHEKLIQQYEQPLASVFSNKKEDINMQLNVSVSIRVTVYSGISEPLSTDRHVSALQSDEVDKNLRKSLFHKIFRKIPQVVGTCSALFVAANNGVQIWQNLHNTENISYLSNHLSRVEKVQLDSRKTD
jgi:hypothetical protein